MTPTDYFYALAAAIAATLISISALIVLVAASQSGKNDRTLGGGE